MEIDIDALDEFLMSDQAPLDCMMLPDLDGFLTGIAIGPELIMPSEWMPVIWGGEQVSFDNEQQAQTILGTIMGRYNDILTQIANKEIEPIFMETPKGEVIAADWAEGFMQAVHLRHKAWKTLLESDQNSGLIVPIAALCCDEKGDCLLNIDSETENSLYEAAGELVPAAVLAIADFWRAEREKKEFLT